MVVLGALPRRQRLGSVGNETYVTYFVRQQHVMLIRNHVLA